MDKSQSTVGSFTLSESEADEVEEVESPMEEDSDSESPAEEETPNFAVGDEQPLVKGHYPTTPTIQLRHQPARRAVRKPAANSRWKYTPPKTGKVNKIIDEKKNPLLSLEILRTAASSTTPRFKTLQGLLESKIIDQNEYDNRKKSTH